MVAAAGDGGLGGALIRRAAGNWGKMFTMFFVGLSVTQPWAIAQRKNIRIVERRRLMVAGGVFERICDCLYASKSGVVMRLKGNT